MTGHNETAPHLAYMITKGLNTVEALQQEINALAKSDPAAAAYLQPLLDRRRRAEEQ